MSKKEMLPKDIKAKMMEYNKLRSQADDLQFEIENYLQTRFGVQTPSDIYGEDGECSMYEFGTEYFDIQQIEEIIAFMKDYRDRVGKDPEKNEVRDYFRAKQR